MFVVIGAIWRRALMRLSDLTNGAATVEVYCWKWLLIRNEVLLRSGLVIEHGHVPVP